MKVLRTPEDRFASLPDFKFQAHYVMVGDMRMHYVDEGPPDGPVVLLLHGEPSWSYLYRHMIPPLADSGLRVVAPDLIGFGKSDKPENRADYSYARHVEWMQSFIAQVDLSGITLFCQDWGSLIGLRVAAENEQRFAAIVLANGGLPTGDRDMPSAFKLWQKFARFSPWFPVGRILQFATVGRLSSSVIEAYDAPFPSGRYKAGARAFPGLVPTHPDDPASNANRQAWEKLKAWEKPFLTAYSDRDPITRGQDKAFLRSVPGSRNQPHRVIADAGHFLQEDKGPELARILIDFISANNSI